ncbi:capsule assembly Wzi family protein [Pseudoalteromonas mariniglutinosa]|uniref:capsule assembly Wzi family protein n=1 Tax=Pseudoalteromonas mariniglutinosa TaxID=206042 RepID=UPI00384E2EDD
MKLVKQVCLSVLCCLSTPSIAGPWIESDDPLLRASVEMLFNQGIIKQPINAYPLMWQGIAHDLQQVNSSELSQSSVFAYQHVKHALENAKQHTDSGVRVNYNSEPELSQQFGKRDQQKSGINSYSSITGDTVSAKVSVNYADGALDKKYINFQDSYLAVLLGNWSLSAEQVSHWWGPSNDNALLLSNNASPMKGVRITRANSEYVGPSWLSFIGNWQLTGIYAKQKPSTLNTENGNYWALRFSSTPLAGLEVAINTVGSDFLNDTFADLNDAALVSKNYRLTSLDVKYSTTIASQPVAFYSEVMGRNSNGLAPQDPFYTIGIESYFGSEQQLLKTYFEYANTQQQCDSDIDCLYTNNNSAKPTTDYRHKDRMLGSSEPMQSKTAVLGAFYHTMNGYAGFATLRWLESHNPISENDILTAKLSRWQLELGYQQGLLNGLWKVSGSVYQDDVNNDTQTNSAIKTSWEYRF